MDFNWHGINSGTDTLGATKLGLNFYFADVESQRNYSSIVTILNPSGGATAHVTVTYIAGGTVLGTKIVVVPPGQRGTTFPQASNINQQCAMYVNSDQPVVVERPMYFTTSRSNISGPITGAATTVEAQAPHTDWLFTEAYTGSTFHQYLVLPTFNPTVTSTAPTTL